MRYGLISNKPWLILLIIYIHFNTKIWSTLVIFFIVDPLRGKRKIWIERLQICEST